MAGYKPRWFIRPQVVTHFSTKRAEHRVTSLIETNTLPLSQAATVVVVVVVIVVSEHVQSLCCMVVVRLTS